MAISYFQILIAIFIGAASGYLGSYMVLRKMSLVGDALSHVALPGIALALLFNLNPFLGAFATLFLGALLIWLIENKTRLSTESLVGLLFTFSLSIGILITPETELLEALFGDISKITRWDVFLSLVLSIAVIWLMRKISKNFILATLSPDLAESIGVRVKTINFVFLLLVTTIVALGIKAVGSLLMGALVIIPAISAKNLSFSMTGYTFVSGIIGVLSLVIGIFLANFYSLPPGPLVVLTSSGFFLISIFSGKLN